MKLTDEKLKQAALLLLNDEIASIPPDANIPDYPVSSNIEELVKELLSQMEHHTLPKETAHMGWQYYTRKGVSVAAIVILLLCTTVPEIVIAGYHKLIEVIETIYEEYTELRYKSEYQMSEIFVPVQLNYIPNNMKLVDSDTDESMYYALYKAENTYFEIRQRVLSNEDEMVYIVDSEDAIIKSCETNYGTMTLYLKENKYNYILLYDKYQIRGQAKIPENELVKIINNMDF